MGETYDLIISIVKLAVASIGLLYALRIATAFYLRKTPNKGSKLFLSVRQINAFLHKRVLSSVLPSLVMGVILALQTGAEFTGNPEKYDYLHTDLAVQTKPSELFAPVPELLPLEEPEDTAIPASRTKLYIPDQYIGAKVTSEMISSFEATFDSIYSDGTRSCYVPFVLFEETHPSYLFVDNKYISEARTQFENYQRTPGLALQYDYARLLNDAGMDPALRTLPFSIKLDLLSDSLYIFEDYLSYSDRQVDGNRIQTEYVALINGKLLIYNAPLADADPEGQKYADCLYAEAYASFKVIAEKSKADNRYHALLSYYTGNAGEQLLARIDRATDPELFETVCSTALYWYCQAAWCLAQDGNNDYAREENLVQNIEKGIATLNTLSSTSYGK